jgi:hypothetical protein
MIYGDCRACNGTGKKEHNKNQPERPKDIPTPTPAPIPISEPEQKNPIKLKKVKKSKTGSNFDDIDWSDSELGDRGISDDRGYPVDK